MPINNIASRGSVLRDASAWKKGTFSWPQSLNPKARKLRLTPEAFAMLTDGVDLKGARMRPWYERE